MPETFLHGVEVIEIDDGPRPIRTVRSSVIGIVGTAPNAQAEVKATLLTGVIGSNNAITFTSKLLGVNGNGISIHLKDPKANSAALSVTVDELAITVNLATSGAGAITTTATQLIAAIAANTAANALVGAVNTGASTGAGAVAASARAQALSGGIDEAFPLNTPVLIAGSRSEVAKLGAAGTLPNALDAILDQAGAVVIVVRVTQGADIAATTTNVIGGVNVGTGAYEGLQAFLGAESTLGFAPRILLAPGFTHQRTTAANPVVAALLGVANKLRAVIIADGPNSTDAAAITYRNDWGSKRVYIVDPFVKTFRDGQMVDEPASPYVAGLIARVDNEQGFWHSPSNKEIFGISGTARVIDFTLGDSTSRANLLNEQEVTTIIRKDGLRLWGNRTASSDPKWAFINVVRTADMINESILQAHMWAVDRNITRTYLDDVTAGVNAYLDRLKAQGAILGGKCWPDTELNTPLSIADGKVFFTFDFTAPYPAEHVTFRSKLVNDYIEEIL